MKAQSQIHKRNETALTLSTDLAICPHRHPQSPSPYYPAVSTTALAPVVPSAPDPSPAEAAAAAAALSTPSTALSPSVAGRASVAVTARTLLGLEAAAASA